MWSSLCWLEPPITPCASRHGRERWGEAQCSCPAPEPPVPAAATAQQSRAQRVWALTLAIDSNLLQDLGRKMGIFLPCFPAFPLKPALGQDAATLRAAGAEIPAGMGKEPAAAYSPSRLSALAMAPHQHQAAATSDVSSAGKFPPRRKGCAQHFPSRASE